MCNHILLRGVAGSGKSTLVSRIAYQWAQSDRDLDSIGKFCLVFALDVRKFVVGDNLEKTIRNQLLPGIDPGEIVRVIMHLGAKCLFLIDGFDELSLKSLKDETQVFESSLLERSYMIVTSRPHSVDNFCGMYTFDCVHVKLSGFS